jgi:hypothetical protein
MLALTWSKRAQFPRCVLAEGAPREAEPALVCTLSVAPSIRELNVSPNFLAHGERIQCDRARMRQAEAKRWMACLPAGQSWLATRACGKSQGPWIELKVAPKQRPENAARSAPQAARVLVGQTVRAFVLGLAQQLVEPIAERHQVSSPDVHGSYGEARSQRSRRPVPVGVLNIR